MENVAFDNPTGTINQGSFNVSDERAGEINEELSRLANEYLNDCPTWDEFYHRHMKPVAQNEGELLYVAFTYGKVVAGRELMHNQMMLAAMLRD